VLTVLFSTFNGAASLPRLLDALEQQTSPPGGWKVVAVDNGSTDGGGDLLRARAARLPLTVLTEPRRGKSRGLNAGLAAVEGDLVVFTDDDVTPPADWLVALRRLAGRQPDYDIFGGAIQPIWPYPPPDWILRCAPQDYFAWTHFEEGPTAPTAVWGPNMAVRRRVLEGRRFFEGIGPDGGPKYAVGAETELLMRAAAAGHRCWHAPDIVVGHLVEPHQLTPAWLLQRAHNHGRGVRRLFGTDEPVGAPRLFGLPRQLLADYAGALAATARSSLAGGFEERFIARHRLSVIEGDLAERLSQRRRRGRTAGPAS